MRNPNTKCSVCGKPIYKRPSQLKIHKRVYCSSKCWCTIRRAKDRYFVCKYCNQKFEDKSYKERIYCSLSCSNKSRRGTTYVKDGYTSDSQRRLAKLKNKFNVKSCMIKNCNYNKTYDIHKLIPEKGYVIGNMFAICPNHHAEIHRNIIKVKKINNHILEIIW